MPCSCHNNTAVKQPPQVESWYTYLNIIIIESIVLFETSHKFINVVTYLVHGVVYVTCTELTTIISHKRGS